MKDFRVIYFTHYTEMYGANRSLIDLITGGKKLYPEFRPVVIVPAEGKLTMVLRNLNVNYDIIPFHSSITNEAANTTISVLKGSIKSFINKLLLFRHCKKLAQFNPDIIHSNSSTFTFGAQVAIKLKRPHIWHIREFIHEDYHYKYDFGESYFRKYLDKAFCAVVITNAILVKRCKGKAGNCKVVYNGIVFETAIMQKQRSKNFSFGMVGLISKGKNQLEGIKAFKKLVEEFPELTLKVYGDFASENYKAEIKNYIKTHKLSNNIEFGGFKNSTDEIFKNIDCLIHCAHHEGMGRVTVEAMSYGIPVIGFDGAGTKEIITSGKDGFLYRTEDQLYETAKLLMLNNDLYNTISFECTKSVKEKFTIEKYTYNIFSIYSSINKF
jgi:glycosyltransferase involved in cell wall biosynthesis